jgi:acetoacetyl-CoA reductase
MLINTGLGALFNMTRQMIDDMRERKFGRIISISSDQLKGLPAP